MKALTAIGYGKAFRFLVWPLVYLVFRCLPYPPLRTAFLKIAGAKIGKNTVIHSIKFFNFYRGTFSNLQIGNDCFLGNEVMFDLAAPIHLGDQVTIAERSIILTHTNVGYTDHPLQSRIPSKTAAVVIKSGCFIGVNSVVLCGVSIGEQTAIGSLSLVDKDVPAQSVYGGVPARPIGK